MEKNTLKKLLNKKFVPVLFAVLTVFLTGSIVHTVSESASAAEAAEVSEAQGSDVSGNAVSGDHSESPSGEAEHASGFAADVDPEKEPLRLTEADLERYLAIYAEASAPVPETAEEGSGEAGEPAGEPEGTGNTGEPGDAELALSISPERALVRRADSSVLSLLILPDENEEGSFLQACSFDPSTETIYGLSDVLTDKASPAAVAAALSENLTALYGESAFTSPNLTALIARALNRGELPWTVDYDGVCFWFGETLPFEVSEASGIIPNVRLTYADHPELVKERFRTVPGRYLSRLTGEERFQVTDGQGTMHYIGLKLWDGSDQGLSRLATVETDRTKAIVDMAYHTFDPYILFSGGKYYLYADAHGDPGLRALFVYDLSAESLAEAPGISAGIGRKQLLPTDPACFEIEKESRLLGNYRIYSFCEAGENGVPVMDSPFYRIDLEDQYYVLKEDLEVLRIRHSGRIQERQFITLHQGVRLIPDYTNGTTMVSFRKDGLDADYRVEVDTSAYPQNVGGKSWQKIFEVQSIPE